MSRLGRQMKVRERAFKRWTHGEQITWTSNRALMPRRKPTEVPQSANATIDNGGAAIGIFFAAEVMRSRAWLVQNICIQIYYKLERYEKTSH